MSGPVEGWRAMGVSNMMSRAVVRGRQIEAKGEKVPKIEGGRLMERAADAWLLEKHRLKPEVPLMLSGFKREVGVEIEKLIVGYELTEEDERAMELVNGFFGLCDEILELYGDVWFRGREALVKKMERLEKSVVELDNKLADERDGESGGWGELGLAAD